MQWIEAKVTLSCNNEELAVELVSDIFLNLGTNGVVVDDPHLEPEEGWGTDAVARPSQLAVAGYLPSDDVLEEKCRSLQAALSRLADLQELTYTLTFKGVDEEDWAESWKAFFYPEAITPTMVVKPTWRDYKPRAGQHIIEIDPGMAFGTGTHPTTALCVQLLEQAVRPGHRVLDVGTGSGILLIAAAKLGAVDLTGVDLDPVAVDIARQNLTRNGIAPDRFTLACGHLVDAVSGTYDIIVANILAEVILELLDQLSPTLAPNSLFICSGIIQAHRDKVARKMAACGYDIEAVLERGDWVALAGRYPAASFESRP